MDGNDVRWLAMRLPNSEVRYIFRKKIMTWFQEKIHEKDLTNLYIAFVNKDTAALEDELNQFMTLCYVANCGLMRYCPSTRISNRHDMNELQNMKKFITKINFED